MLLESDWKARQRTAEALVRYSVAYAPAADARGRGSRAHSRRGAADAARPPKTKLGGSFAVSAHVVIYVELAVVVVQRDLDEDAFDCAAPDAAVGRQDAVQSSLYIVE